MINSIPKIFLILCLFAFGGNEMFSQGASPIDLGSEPEPIYIGPIAGYNRVMHSTNKPAIPLALDDVPCPNFENGSANGFFVGASFEYILGKAANSNSSIIVRAMYNTFPSYFEQQGDNLPTTVNVLQPNGTYVPEERITSINYLNDVDYSTISMDVLYKFNFLPISGNLQLGAVAGPTVDFALTTAEINRMRLVSPDNARLIQADPALIAQNGWSYPADGKTLQFNDGDIAGATSLRVGLKLGLQLEYSLEGVLIVPNVMYNLGLTNLSPDYDWRVSALQFGVDVRFAVK